MRNEAWKNCNFTTVFQGYPRNINMHYEDVMKLVRAFRNPSFFRTLTCNLKWKKYLTTYSMIFNQISAQNRLPEFSSMTYAYSKYVAVIFRHSCLPVFASWRVVLNVFDSKQLLLISCILWCFYSKCFSIIKFFTTCILLNFQRDDCHNVTFSSVRQRRILNEKSNI